MNTHNISLEMMLDSREARERRILELVAHYPQLSIISYTLNIPGPIKNSSRYRFAFYEGMGAFSSMDHLVYLDVTAPTGPSAIFLSLDDPLSVKKRMVAFEDEMTLGRLFDLDVHGVNRAVLSLPPRKCLLCNEPAHACSRSRKHGLDEVLKAIDALILENI